MSGNLNPEETRHVEKTGMKCLRKYSQKWDHANNIYIFFKIT